jgi:DNA polymerase-3 subunit epsilon
MNTHPGPSAQSRKLIITRPITFIDLETTGSILGLDRIVEVGAVKILPDSADEPQFESRVNPEMGITPEATKMHGISDTDVRDAPTFAMVAPRLADFLDNGDLGGFNLRNFDLPMLQAEFRRVGLSLPINDRRVVDVMDIFVQKEPRDLKSAYRFYCGREYKGGHAASTDARACWSVLQGQLRKYKDLPSTPERLSAYIAEHRRKRALDSGGWFIPRHGKPALARGKYQGMLIREIEETDPDYLDWMLSLGLPEDTIEVVRTVLPNFGK